MKLIKSIRLAIHSYLGIPEGIPSRDHSLYNLNIYTWPLAIANHFMFFVILLIIEEPLLVAYNSISIFIFLFNIFLTRKGYLYQPILIYFFEVHGFAWIGIAILGWYYGFQYWLIPNAMAVILAVKWPNPVKALLIVVFSGIFYLLAFVYQSKTNQFIINTPMHHALHFINITGTFVSSALIAYYYLHVVTNAEIALTDEKNKLQSQNEILENELLLARKIQEQLIPRSNPSRNIHSLYKPMEQVGGDFYDFLTFEDNDNIGIFISDVSGHGVPAAFITSMIKTTILQAGERINDPAGLLFYMNEVLRNQTAGNFITAYYGIYNPLERTLIYSNAGHPQPYLITDNAVLQLQGGKNTALAMFPNSLLAKSNKFYTNFSEKLPLNSKLLLYTDGLTEARPTDNNSLYFEYASMVEIFKKNGGLPCGAFIEELYSQLAMFRGSDSFEDDICLICIDAV